MNVTLLLIIATCLISFAGLQNETFFNKLAHSPYDEATRNEKYRLLSGGFLHADFWHLFINMFVLHNFGGIVEYKFQEIYGESIGKVVFLLFYLLMIILANLPSYNKHKSNYSYRAIGASGAVASVLFSFIIFYPLEKLQLYLFIPIPAIIFGILYLWYEKWADGKGGSNIGHDAHFYGAVAGTLFTIFMKPSLLMDFVHQIKSVFL
jgi:membrane associated rhomboid family serine protease